MKLNHDCIRDILLALEENLLVDDFGKIHFISLKDIIRFENMKLYPKADIIYCSCILDKAGLVSIEKSYADNELQRIIYYDITPNGYQYLDSIRDKTIWTKTKEIIEKYGGTVTISLINTIAKKVLDSANPFL